MHVCLLLPSFDPGLRRCPVLTDKCEIRGLRWSGHSIPVCETVGIAEREVDLRLGSSLDFPHISSLTFVGQFPLEGPVLLCNGDSDS